MAAHESKVDADQKYHELNIDRLKSYAAHWAEEYPAINRICLYLAHPEETEGVAPIKFVIVAEAPAMKRNGRFDDPDFQKKAKAALRAYLSKTEPQNADTVPASTEKNYNELSDEILDEYEAYLEIRAYFRWAREDCSHIAEALSNVYLNQRDRKPNEGWLWYRTERSEELNDYLVDPTTEVVLYADESEKDKTDALQTNAIPADVCEKEIKNVYISLSDEKIEIKKYGQKSKEILISDYFSGRNNKQLEMLRYVLNFGTIEVQGESGRRNFLYLQKKLIKILNQ